MPGTALVYGVGVIGSVYALRLAKAGYDVTVIARGERLEELRTRGLVIRNEFLGEEEKAGIRPLASLPPNESFDLVIVAVRAGQVMDALREVARLAGFGVAAVIGNNLGDYDAEAAIVGKERFVLGFGVFGGYRDKAVIAYTDGRTKKKPEATNRSKTTLGILGPVARPALDALTVALDAAGLPSTECKDMPAWLVCHAALVFPLAGAMYAAGGEQDRTCRTRDAVLLGVRASKELFGALGRLEYRVEPKSLISLLVMPEWALVPMLQKTLAGEGARIAMFGHANAVGGRDEIGMQAIVLDTIARPAGMALPHWDRLLPYLSGSASTAPLKDGAADIRFRLW